MSVANIVEKVELVPGKEQRCCNAMHRCISPSLRYMYKCTVCAKDDKYAYLIIESAGFIEMIEVSWVGLATPKVHVCYFKVTPDCLGNTLSIVKVMRLRDRTMTQVVALPIIIGQESHCIIRMKIFRIVLGEVCREQWVGVYRQEEWAARYPLLTVFHNVGIVASNSYSAIVNPACGISESHTK